MTGDTNAHGDGLTMEVTVEADLEAFDKLPQPARRLIANAHKKFTAVALLPFWRRHCARGATVDEFRDWLMEQIVVDRLKIERARDAAIQNLARGQHSR